MKFIALLLPFFLMACSNPPVRHDHTIYEYKIKYGSSLNNLDKEFVKTCEDYIHGNIKYVCNTEPLEKIDNYFCDVDNRLYINNTVQSYSRYSNSSSSTVPLDNVYCQLQPVKVTTQTYDLIEHYTFQTKKDVEVLIKE